MSVNVVSVNCPICHEQLEYEHISRDGKAYGTIPIWDTACAEITINDPSRKIQEHIGQHHRDGTYSDALVKQMKLEYQRAKKFLKEEDILELNLVPLEKEE